MHKIIISKTKNDKWNILFTQLPVNHNVLLSTFKEALDYVKLCQRVSPRYTDDIIFYRNDELDMNLMDEQDQIAMILTLS